MGIFGDFWRKNGSGSVMFLEKIIKQLLSHALYSAASSDV
jgi:hypothetical protein